MMVFDNDISLGYETLIYGYHVTTLMFRHGLHPLVHHFFNFFFFIKITIQILRIKDSGIVRKKLFDMYVLQITRT